MELPEKIHDTLERIRKDRRHYVDIKVIGGRCYVYESTSRWDSKEKKVKKIAKYIGKITEEGEFVESVPRKPGLEAAKIKSVERRARIRRIVGGGAVEHVGKYEEGILKALSSDGRITIADLGKGIGLKNTAAEWQRSNLERKYGINYIAEVDVGKFGWFTSLVFIKFENRKPSISQVKRELEKEPNIQLAMLTYGRYDLIMYIVVSEYEDIKKQLYTIRSNIFADYDLKLYVAPFYEGYCFVPLRERFFDLLKESVWTRKKGSPRPKPGELLEREYAVLKELSGNGKEDFTEIDKKYGLTHGSARYTYHRLVERGVIRRITITMQSLPLKYISAIFLQKINHVKFTEYRPKLMQHIIGDFENSVTNKYALEGDVKMPEGVFFLLPAFSDRDAIVVDDELEKIEGAEVDSMIVTNVLVGSLCYRKFDKRLSSQYNILKNEYGLREGEL